MTVHIGHVAARAGVSVATVSRALRGLPHVAPATRARVLQAAEELRYVADPHASRLAAGRTTTIGMVVPLLHQWYFGQVVSGAESVLAAADYDVLLYSVGRPDTRQRFLTSQPFRKRVDGLIVVDLPLDDADQAALAAAGTPVVTVGIPSTCFPTVTIDNVTAAASGARHLVNLGHKRIGLIGGRPDDPLHFSAPLERRSGYQAVLGEHGLDARADLDVPGDFSLEGGAEAMARLLSAARPPTAVFALSDEMAIGALRTVRNSGLRVPADVSVMGFDDHDMAEVLGLTTVGQPVVSQGEAAARLLLEVIDDESASEPRHVVRPTTLRVRETTGPPRQESGVPGLKRLADTHLRPP